MLVKHVDPRPFRELYGSEEAGRSGGARDTRYLRDELDEMEHQVAMLTRELKDKDRQLQEERQISDRYITRAEDAERELRDVRRENENMHEEIRDYQRQLEAQRETMVTKRDEDAEYHDRIKSKNRLLNEALDENKTLAGENDQYLDKIEALKQEMRDGKSEIEKTTDDYLKLKLVVQQSDQTIVSLQRENEVLRHQLDDMLEQIQSRGDMDDDIIVQVNKKVEEWKDILAEKDNQNLALQGEIAKLKAQILATNMDDDRRSVAMLTKGVEDRDKQIAVLEKKLSDAVGDMENNMTLMDDVRAEIHKGTQGSGESHQERVTNLLKKLQLMERCLHEAEKKSEEAERDARSKDRQLSEALDKMRKYEEGIYGLPEAVAEIKELKMQISMQDRHIEGLTQYINKCELKINDLFDEVEELRERLGLDPKEPIDLGEFRKKKSVRTQEEKALNQVLRKEIERLEEERVTLKQDIRKLAQATGQRALTLGLSVDDVVAVDSFIDDLKCKKTSSMSTSAQIKNATEIKELKLRNAESLKELDQNNTKLQRVTESNTELKVRLKNMEEENRGLEKGMREIHNAIKEHRVEGLGGAGGAVLECPSLEQMLAAMETRSVEGKYDTLLSLKSKVSNLQGHNDELRSVLREVRYEATKAKVDLEKAASKVEMYEGELKALKQAGAGAFFQTMTLPEGMSVTSSDIIASLNEHLILVLQEVSLKEEMLEKMESAIETYRRKFAIARHQMGLLYQEHHQEKQVWKEEEEKLKEQLRTQEGASSEDQVRIQEFDRLVETLGTDDVEVRRRLAELTRKVTVLRVNEKALTRRYTSLQEVEGSLRKTINKLKNEMIAMETAVAERLGYLQRYKDMASFKIATLQKQLDTSVAAEDLGLANKRYTELTEKYRDLLGKSNMLVARTEESSGYEVEMKRLHNENNVLKKELEIEKEKLHTLEAAFDNMKGQGMLSSKDLKNSEILSISKKMTTLEMKELNERQRAEHAVHMYDMQKQQLRDLEDRNFELEQKFSELTKMHLETQKVERDLRDELAESVTKEVSDADRRRLSELEQTEATLKLEVSKLKDIAEVASCQVRAFETHQESRDKELMSLRQQLVDFQAQSDEKTVIGKLHRQIVQMQVSEGIALKKLDDAAKKKTKLEAQLLRTEQKLDEKDETIYHNRMECCNKSKHLKHTIH
ncbi:CEP209_CC5 domain-containing protein, partial [Lamellibrachia satsuma]